MAKLFKVTTYIVDYNDEFDSEEYISISNTMPAPIVAKKFLDIKGGWL